MLNLIMKLISFDSTQTENKAMEYLQHYVQNIYGDTLIYEQQTIGDKERYNLIIKNTEQPDIILAWHVDTVPEFSQEQFIPTIYENKLYGRGAVDMKAGVGINITLIDFMIKHHIKFWVMCYADEENDCLWMQKFVQIYGSKIHPKLTIITEPTNTCIYTWFRGIASLELEIQWKSVHSARKHLGINAIEEYIYFMDHLEKYMQSKDTQWYVSLTNLAGIYWWMYKNGEIICQDNIVPSVAKWRFSLRLGNTFTYQDFEAFMYDYFQKKWITVVDIHLITWYNPLIQIGLQEKYGMYGDVQEWYSFWYSDIQLIKEYIGWDCLLIWPGPNEKSHQADEYVDIESIQTAKKIIENILQDSV